MKEAREDLVAYLEAAAGPEVALRVAEEFADSVGSTKKFAEFLLTYLPDPPEVRPDDWGQADWSVEGLRRSFRQIYGYRSRALHDGMPFPAPHVRAALPTRDMAMCRRPADRACDERRGRTWLAKDTPMFLRTFEYIARKALMKWWTSIAAAG